MNETGMSRWVDRILIGLLLVGAVVLSSSADASMALSLLMIIGLLALVVRVELERRSWRRDIESLTDRARTLSQVGVESPVPRSARFSALGTAIEDLGDATRRAAENLAGLYSGPIGADLAGLGRVIDRAAAGDLAVDWRSGTADKQIQDVEEGLGRLLNSVRRTIEIIRETCDDLSGRSKDLTKISTTLGGLINTTAELAESGTHSTGEVNTQIHSIAAAIEELSASVQEISRSAQHAAVAAQQSARATGEAEGLMHKLEASAGRISGILATINKIAKQTNLLALNATIEAARAGDHGKGFAVVANEVKELAQETARATLEISEAIGLIQTDSHLATEAISQIGSVIGGISEFQQSIAGAVEEQSAVISHLSGSVQIAAGGSESIDMDLEVLSMTLKTTLAENMATEQAAGRLIEIANNLTLHISSFKT